VAFNNQAHAVELFNSVTLTHAELIKFIKHRNSQLARVGRAAEKLVLASLHERGHVARLIEEWDISCSCKARRA
jgi:hypothetical protein